MASTQPTGTVITLGAGVCWFGGTVNAVRTLRPDTNTNELGELHKLTILNTVTRLSDSAPIQSELMAEAACVHGKVYAVCTVPCAQTAWVELTSRAKLIIPRAVTWRRFIIASSFSH